MDSENPERSVDPGIDFVEVTPSSNQSTRRKLWCFTLFTDAPGTPAVAPTELPSGFSFMIFQEEICPSTQRHHYQGFVRVESPHGTRFTQVKRLVQTAFHTTKSPWIGWSRGTIEQNIRYCSKVDTRVPGTQTTVLGEQPMNESNGKPSPTPKIIDAIVNQKLTPRQAILREDVDQQVKTYALRFARTWEHLMLPEIEHRSIVTPPTVIVMYGLSGSGKTKLACEMYPKAYIKSPGKWWDHYSGETEVIYDDFDGPSMTFTDFKRIFDRYPMFNEYKGGTTKLASTVHIITTNVYPSHWWCKKVTGEQGREAIWRRITQVWHFWSMTHPAKVYDSGVEFRALPENFGKEQEDPKARPE